MSAPHPSLFEVDDDSRPLDDRIRPRALTDVVGQDHLLMPPAHILNAPTRLRKNLGYGKGYQSDPDTGFSGANYFPDGMPRETFYEPTSGGYERAITERLEHRARLRATLTTATDNDPRASTTD
jgi:putative ATPase